MKREKKRKQRLACNEAQRINSIGNQPIDVLDTPTLGLHLYNIYVFKLGLKNSFGIDFRETMHTSAGDSPSSKPVLFNYLSEALPLIQSRVNRLPKRTRDAYEKLADAAISSFWEVYYRFQPLIHRAADESGLDIDALGNVLGRAILLYDGDRGFRFYTYFKKTLAESAKNLRGSVLAGEYGLPLSAGRLLPKIWWLLDQESLRRQRKLTPNESDEIVIEFLRGHSARFSESTMNQVAQVIHNQPRTISIDQTVRPNQTKSGLVAIVPDRTDDSLEAQEEYEQLTKRIHDAMDRANFTKREQTILLQRLDIAHDADMYHRIENELSAGSLRNRRSQLLVRFIASFHSAEAKRFGKFLHADPLASKPVLYRALQDLSNEFDVHLSWVIRQLLNEMTLTKQAYRLTINERGRLESFLLEHPLAKKTTITGHLYNKLKACLVEQDRTQFECLRRSISD